MTDDISSAADTAAGPAPFPSPADPDPRNASPFTAAARAAAGPPEVSFGGGVRHEAVARRQTSVAVLPPEPSAPSTGMRRVSDGIVGGLVRAGGGAVSLVTFLSGDVSFTRGPAGGGGEPLPVASSGSSVGGGSGGPSGRTKSGTAELGGHFGFQGGYARDRDEFRPRAAVPFNLDPDSDDDSSVGGVPGCNGCLSMPTHPAGRPGHVGRSRRGPGAVKTARGFEYPTHAVQLGNGVTFLPTPLKNWWGKPGLLTAWLVFACCLLAIQTAHMVMYYFLITTLIIYPTAVIAAILGIVGGTRFRQQRRKIGSFDAAQSVEVTKLLAVVATLLTACSFIAWLIISAVWVSRKQACSGRGISCSAAQLCENFQPCYVAGPSWVTGVTTTILGALMIVICLPYILISTIIFIRARAASYYFVDNLTA